MYDTTYHKFEQVLEMTPSPFRHAWHQLNRLLNTVWSCCLEISDTAHLKKQLLHDSPAASLIVECTVKLNHCIYSAQFNLLFDKHVKHSVKWIHFVCEYAVGFNTEGFHYGKLYKKNHMKSAMGNL